MTLLAMNMIGMIIVVVGILNVLVSPAIAGKVRSYFIAAKEVNWDYAPEGRDLVMGMDFSEEQNVFVKKGPDRMGSIYPKIRYIGFTDSTFKKKTPEEDASHGILGPVIRAEVGDQITITFRNDASMPLSIHPHGVFYTKGAEGSMTNDGSSHHEMMDDHVKPKTTYVYNWSVPERAGPGPGDTSSVVWLYHSHVDEIRDTNTGLIGPMVITKKGSALKNGRPKDVDKEFFSLYSVLNENESLFFDKFVATLAHPAEVVNDPEFEESNLMHAINGYVYGNMPMPTMEVGDRVRWYTMALGTEVDLHTPHWHGNTVLVGGHRKDVVSLLPADTLVADMVPDNAGIWMYHCHVNDHISAGMTGRFEVKPKQKKSLRR